MPVARGPIKLGSPGMKDIIIMIPAKTVAIAINGLPPGALYGRTMSGSTIRSLSADADVINQPTQNPTGTLGCGSWGNNSLSENLSYEHLINISRIAYTDNNAHIPTPEEVWGE
jgi:hypothetical protein